MPDTPAQTTAPAKLVPVAQPAAVAEPVADAAQVPASEEPAPAEQPVADEPVPAAPKVPDVLAVKGKAAIVAGVSEDGAQVTLAVLCPVAGLYFETVPVASLEVQPA